MTQLDLITILVVAGGMESMTNAPHILPKSRDGLRLGHGSLLDHMFCDGLEDAFDKGRLMGSFAEQCAKKYGFTRQAQDEFAIESLKRARKQRQFRRASSKRFNLLPLTVGRVIIQSMKMSNLAKLSSIKFHTSGQPLKRMVQ